MASISASALAAEINSPGPRNVSAAIIGTLETCPEWADPRVRPEAIMSSLMRLTNYDSADLREAIETFVRECSYRNNYTVGNMSKLFILNRILFAVPPKEKVGGPFFGGWEGIPHDQNEIDRLWPLSLNSQGGLCLTGKFAGYNGPNFLAVGEFDHFRRKYGRRTFNHKKK